MDVYQSILLGIIQGLTEFLPVSSSGHLVLMQNIFGLTEPELFFDISLHMGTLIAVCFVFFFEIKAILLTLIRLPMLFKTSNGIAALLKENGEIRMAALIIGGSIPTAIMGILFHEMADQLFGSVWIVGAMLLVTGTLLWLTRRISFEGRVLDQMNSKDALILGLIQGLAIIPGISRSGSTISVALFLKIDRELAGRYSFLLSIPAMLGALIMGLNSEALHGSVSGGIILVGTITAGFVGYIALRFLLRIVKMGRLYLFAPYCWLAGVLALIFSR